MSRDREVKKCAIIERRFSRSVNKRKLSPLLIEGLIPPFAKMADEKGWVNSNTHNLSLTKKGKEEIDRVRRALGRMENKAMHHSQQASKRAEKTIRAIIGGKLTGDGILDHVAEFGSLRMQGIRANARAMPFADAEEVQFKSKMSVHLLTTEKDVAHVGRVLENCLAERELGGRYISLARKGDIKLHALRDIDGQPVALLCIRTGDNFLMEVKGIGNSRPWAYRAQILHFLVRAGVRCNDCRDAADLALCDALIQACADRSRDKCMIDDVTYEVAPDSLAIRHGSDTALLRKRGTSDLRVTVGTGGNAAGARRRLRRGLQDALATSTRLRAACDAAFGKMDVANKKFWKRDDE